MSVIDSIPVLKSTFFIMAGYGLSNNYRHHLIHFDQEYKAGRYELFLGSALPVGDDCIVLIDDEPTLAKFGKQH